MSATENVEIKDLKFEIEKGLASIQEKNTSLEEKGVKFDEELGKLQEKFNESVEKLESTIQELNAEKKAREELELAMARKTDGNENEVKGNPEYRQAFWKALLTKGEIPSELVEEEVKMSCKQFGMGDMDINNDRELKTHIVGSNPDGGYFVPVDLRTEILQRAFEQTPIRDLAEVTTTTSDAIEYPYDDDITLRAVRRNEIDAVAETGTGQFGTFKIEVSELYSFPRVSEKMIEDSIINTEQFIRNKISSDFARTESKESIDGDGVLEFRGILTYDAWATQGTYERGKLETRETATDNTLAGDDLIKVQADLLETFQGNSTWLMNRLFWAQQITTLKDGNDAYLLNPQLLFSGVTPQLLGRPVRFSPDMVDNITAGTADKLIVYGDFRAGYLIVDRIGISFVRDNITQPGFVKIRARKRSGAGVQNFQALKILQNNIP